MLYNCFSFSWILIIVSDNVNFILSKACMTSKTFPVFVQSMREIKMNYKILSYYWAKWKSWWYLWSRNAYVRTFTFTLKKQLFKSMITILSKTALNWSKIKKKLLNDKRKHFLWVKIFFWLFYIFSVSLLLLSRI